MDSRNEKIYGLIGFPLGHSFSQGYFNQKFESEKINAVYRNFELPDIGDFMELVAETPMLAGLNVTIPYKQLVIPYMDEMDPVAADIGAVNVIKVMHGSDGYPRFKGYNTDVLGFRDSLRPMLRECHRKALVLGTGGAAKAVRYALESMGIDVQYVSRTKKDGVLTYGELDADIMASHRIIVNTTPLGMYPDVDGCPDIPYEYITDENLCYDLLYNPDVTMFMRRSRQQGATVKNGLEMLLLQAFASWKIWNS